LEPCAAVGASVTTQGSLESEKIGQHARDRQRVTIASDEVYLKIHPMRYGETRPESPRFGAWPYLEDSHAA